MAYSSPVVLLALLLATMSMLVHTRALTNTTTIGTPSLAARLKLENDQDGGSPGCWETLLELHACTREIILFFLNGETYLGTGCCRAIKKIEKLCWPSLMGSLGFTTEEGDILRGYCDVSDDGDIPTTPPPPAAPTVAPPPHSANATLQ
ncbi:egg cell-secreted protein 1.4-like [Bidens hawaiensis]|uniref:egg cell-secreted protein 1.4-like n=1 Tax=Bidens hawaiensis TaxID=980011 RepID=UPI004049C478